MTKDRYIAEHHAIVPMTHPFDGWVEFDAQNWVETGSLPRTLVIDSVTGEVSEERWTEEDINAALDSLDLDDAA